MSRPVDEQIVRMELQNKDFLSRAKDSLIALKNIVMGSEKLKNVSMGNLDKKAMDVSKALNNVKTDPLANGVQTVANKFSMLQQIALGALMRIGSRVTDLGINMAKKLSIQPMLAGFQMYENKLKTIQVILSNTMGESSLDDVEKSLADLNDYANKTVYSFEDMTRNMGTFTAAGVKLNTAQTAIKGIANLAAVSGSNTQQAGTAMYQLSQALAAGRVTLMDWNSVVNAGMGGKKFQTALQKTAKEMGKNVDSSKSFRDSLQEGWLTADVLTNTLEKFATDKSMLKAATQAKTFHDAMDNIEDSVKSGWAETWELLLGGFKTAPKVWTAFSDEINGIFDNMAASRNKLLKGFNKLGGQKLIINTVVKAWEVLKKIVSAVSDAFRDVFPATTSKRLYSMVKSVNQFFKGMFKGGTALKDIGNIARGVFSAVDIVLTVLKGIGKVLVHLFPKELGSGLLKILGNIGNVITNIDMAMKGLISWGDIFKPVTNGASQGYAALRKLGKSLGSASTFFEKLGSLLGSLLVPAFKALGKLVEALTGGIKGLFSGVSIGDIVTGGLVVGVLKVIKNIKKIAGGLSETMDTIMAVFKDGAKGFSSNILLIGNALRSFTNMVNAAALVVISASIFMLASSISKLSKLDGAGVAKGLTGIGVSAVILIKSLSAISKLKAGGTMAAAFSVLELSIALSILASALTKIGKMDPRTLGTGIAGLAAAMAIMIGAMKGLSSIDGKISQSALTMMGLATSILILASAVDKFGSMDIGTLIKGLGSIGLAMAGIALFSKSLAASKIRPSQAIAVGAIATALVIMASGVKLLGGMDISNLVKGLSSVAIIMGELALSMKLMPSGAKVAASAVSMVILASAINLMIPPIVVLGSMKMESLAKGLGAIGIVLAELVATLAVSGLAKNGILGAVGIAAVAASLTIIVPIIAALGLMSWETIAKGLAGIGGALAIFVAAGALAGVVAPGLLILSLSLGALALVLVSAGAAAAGMGLLANGVADLIKAISSSGDKSIDSFKKMIEAIVDVVVESAPRFALAAVDFVVAFAQALADGAPKIAQAGIDLILGLLQAVSDNIYQIVDTAVTLILNFAQAIVDNTYRLVEAGVEMIITFIDGLAQAIRDNSDKIVQSVLGIIEAILEVIVEALTRIVKVLFGWIPGFNGMMKNIGRDGKAALRSAFDIEKVGDEKAKGYVTSVNGRAGDAKKAGEKLGSSAKKGSDVSLDGTGSKSGKSYAKGVREKADSAKKSGEKLGKNAKKGSKVSLKGTGKQAGSGFAKGLSSSIGDVVEAAKNLGKSALGTLKSWLHIKSPSRKMMEVGDYTAQGFAIGIRDNASLASDAALFMGAGMMTATKRTVSNINRVVSDGIDLNPTIEPSINTGKLAASSRDIKQTVDLSMQAGTVVGTIQGQIAQNQQQQKELLALFGEVNNKLDQTIKAVQEEKQTTVVANIDGNRVTDAVKDKMRAAFDWADYTKNRLNGVKGDNMGWTY